MRCSRAAWRTAGVPVPGTIRTIAFEAVKKQTVEERRNEILEVTCQVVIERGFAGTRISDVAKRLDVSSSLIHYHFDSKEALLAEAFAHYAQNDLAEMEGEIASAPTATAQLDRLIQNMVPEGSDEASFTELSAAWAKRPANSTAAPAAAPTSAVLASSKFCPMSLSLVGNWPDDLIRQWVHP